jgi:hypothetical protein
VHQRFLLQIKRWGKWEAKMKQYSQVWWVVLEDLTKTQSQIQRGLCDVDKQVDFVDSV